MNTPPSISPATATPTSRCRNQLTVKDQFVSVDSVKSEDVEYRIEHDTMGEVRVPAAALWRAQTQRAVENFPISGRPLPPALIHALARIKGAAARANAELGVVSVQQRDAIVAAVGEIV